MNERRSHFLINKPLQLRYMLIIISTLLLVTSVVIVSFYFGIWGSVLDAFSNNQMRDEMLIASRLTEYENVRYSGHENTPSTLSFFRQADRLSTRQKEVFKKILDDTHRKLLPKCLLLLALIAWGSIYLSHKIAGPLYRFHVSLQELERGNMNVRIHLRNLDEAHFIELQFNHTAETLDALFDRMKAILVKNADSPEKLKSLLYQELSKIKTSEPAP